ncbi:hypothetical protein HDU85_003613 [Gaertneriomyces sp. JEL0708]|nr:hypothetical protein HDU85_003613 [Gaertneriomyces sp. JEL0708]
MAEIEEKYWPGLPVPRKSDTLQLTHLSIGFVLHIFCIAASFFAIWVFFRTDDLRRGQNKWHNWMIFVMCLTDIGLNIFQFGSVIDQFMRGGWYLSDSWCQFQGFTSFAFAVTSFNILGLLTQERAYTILLGKDWTGTQTALGLLWGVGSSFFIASGYFYKGGKIALHEAGIYCAPDYGAILRPQPEPKIAQVFSLMIIVISMTTDIVVVAVYVAIWLKVRRVSMAVKRYLMSVATTTPHDANRARDPADTPIASATKATGASPDFPEDDPIKPPTKVASADTLLARKCCIMVVVFLATFFPTCLKIIINTLLQRTVPRWFDVVGALLTVSGALFNPVVNAVVDPRWRRPTLEALDDIRRGVYYIVGSKLPARPSTKTVGRSTSQHSLSAAQLPRRRSLSPETVERYPLPHSKIVR